MKKVSDLTDKFYRIEKFFNNYKFLYKFMTWYEILDKKILFKFPWSKFYELNTKKN